MRTSESEDSTSTSVRSRRGERLGDGSVPQGDAIASQETQVVEMETQNFGKKKTLKASHVETQIFQTAKLYPMSTNSLTQLVYVLTSYVLCIYI